jgi:hypothetical protein
MRTNSSINDVRSSWGGDLSKSIINDIKPKLLESDVTQNEKFFRLSSGFKQIFASDKEDRKMAMPIVGYGGHRRGDKS